MEWNKLHERRLAAFSRRRLMAGDKPKKELKTKPSGRFAIKEFKREGFNSVLGSYTTGRLFNNGLDHDELAYVKKVAGNFVFEVEELSDDYKAVPQTCIIDTWGLQARGNGHIRSKCGGCKTAWRVEDQEEIKQLADLVRARKDYSDYFGKIADRIENKS